MEIDLTGPLPGQYPYRLTHEDRFQYRVKVQPVAGQLEFSVRPVDTRLAALAAERQWAGYPNRTGPVPETDRQDNVRKATFRAKGRVKLLAMEMRVDRLFTFTVRLTGSPLPYDTVLAAWDYFRRMAQRVDKGFHYLATPEQQANGQWHIHAGLSGFQNVANFTRMWQISLNRVLGRSQDLYKGADSPGTCNIPTKKRPKKDANGRAKAIAKYIGKYIGKDLQTGFNRKKYFHSTGTAITPAQSQWLKATTRDDAFIEVCRNYGIDPTVELRSTVWRRDSCSLWFTVPAVSIPPPF